MVLRSCSRVLLSRFLPRAAKLSSRNIVTSMSSFWLLAVSVRFSAFSRKASVLNSPDSLSTFFALSSSDWLPSVHGRMAKNNESGRLGRM